MTLVDTSAWVDFLRRTESGASRSLRRRLEKDAPLFTTDVVVMELLAGARDAGHERRLRRLLFRCSYLPVEGLAAYETAAGLYRTCRHAGETVRALTDCLIGAVALRTGTPVLHHDHDFDVLARHAGVPVTPLEPEEPAGR